MANSGPRDNDPQRSAREPDLRRLTCTRCGANNFPTSLTCWQCGTPQAGASSVLAGQAPSNGRPGLSSEWTAPAGGQANFSANSLVPREQVDFAVADRAAAFLGFFLPFVGLPVGIVFLMLDDARKARLGWIAIGWSTIGTIASVILSFMAIVPALSSLKEFLPHPGGGGSGAPGMPSIPGLPSGGGGIPDLQIWLNSCLGLLR